MSAPPTPPAHLAGGAAPSSAITIPGAAAFALDCPDGGAWDGVAAVCREARCGGHARMRDLLARLYPTGGPVLPASVRPTCGAIDLGRWCRASTSSLHTPVVDGKPAWPALVVGDVTGFEGTAARLLRLIHTALESVFPSLSAKEEWWSYRPSWFVPLIVVMTLLLAPVVVVDVFLLLLTIRRRRRVIVVHCAQAEPATVVAPHGTAVDEESNHNTTTVIDMNRMVVATTAGNTTGTSEHSPYGNSGGDWVSFRATKSLFGGPLTSTTTTASSDQGSRPGTQLQPLLQLPHQLVQLLEWQQQHTDESQEGSCFGHPLEAVSASSAAVAFRGTSEDSSEVTSAVGVEPPTASGRRRRQTAAAATAATPLRGGTAPPPPDRNPPAPQPHASFH